MMNTQNCIIVHGCPSTPEDDGYNKHWMPWTKKKLEENGIKTALPTMPAPWNPEYEKFRNVFEELKVSKDTTLIGHSCGCAFLVRWLGENKINIAKLILVAPWKVATKEKVYREKFYSFSIDTTLKDRVEKIIMFTSENEKRGGKESLKVYHDFLGGTIINLNNHGHYTYRDMGTEEFPELIDSVLS